MEGCKPGHLVPWRVLPAQRCLLLSSAEQQKVEGHSVAIPCNQLRPLQKTQMSLQTLSPAKVGNSSLKQSPGETRPHGDSVSRTAPSDSYSRAVLVNPRGLRNDYPWGFPATSYREPRHQDPVSSLVSSPLPFLPANQNPRRWQLPLYPRGIGTNGTQGLCSFNLQ